MSTKASTMDANLIQRFSLSNASDPTKCLYDLELNNQTVLDLGLLCSNDYNPYFDASSKCDDKQWMNTVSTKNTCKSKLYYNI